jgi:ABC-type phosphate transport system permease subunit
MPARPSISRGLLEHVRAGSVVIVILVWISFLWERFTGLTFVLSKSSRALGENSSAAHLQGTFEAALIATLICVPLAYYCGVMMRGDGE